MEHESTGGGGLTNKCVRRPSGAFERQKISQPSGIRSLKLMAVASEIVFAAAFPCTTASFAQSGTMFRGDLAHTGVYGSAAPKNINHILWEFKTGGRIFSSPVVADGIVYVGSDHHSLHAIHPGT